LKHAVLTIGLICGVLLFNLSAVAAEKDAELLKQIEAAAKSGSKGKFSEAGEAIKQLLTAYPEHEALLLAQQIAADAVAGQLTEKAAKELFKSLREYSKGKPDKAVKAVDKALKKQADYLPALYLRAFYHLSESKSDEAIADYDRILSIAPKEEKALWEKAQILEAKVEYTAALAAIDELLKHNPDHAAAHALRGTINQQLGDAEAAMNDFLAAARLAPDADLFYQIGETYLQNKMYQKAVRYFTKHLALDTASVYGYLNRGVAYYEMGKASRAIDDFYDALERNPQFSEAYFYRGMAYADLKLYKEALADFNKVIEIDPQHARAYYQRGRIYHLRGQRKSAIADYDKALALDPQFANAAYFKAQAYDELKNAAAARAAYQAYLNITDNAHSEQARYAQRRIRALK
jgi:tetratricopeptide (TPR) repeat protein